MNNLSASRLPRSGRPARDGVLRELLRNRTMYMMALPALVGFLLFAYLPMAGTLIAFKNFNFTEGFWGIFSSEFMSPLFRNFEFFFTSGYAWRVTRNTLLLNSEFILFGIVFQVGFAILLNEVRNGAFRRIVQTFSFLPYFVSWIVLSIFVYNLLNYDTGVLNTLLSAMGFERYDFYADARVWPFIMNAVYFWKNTGYGIVLYLAVIGGFDESLYEAAEMDGATRFKQAMHITLPLLKPTILILLLMNIGHIMNADFGMFYSVVGGNAQLYKSVDVIDTFVYRALRGSGDISMASAAGFYQSILSFALVIISNRIVKNHQEEASLF